MRIITVLTLILVTACAMAEPHGYLKIPDIDGEAPQSQFPVEPRRAQESQGPLYPAGWEQLVNGDEGGSRIGTLQPAETQYRETYHSIDQSSPYYAW